MIAWPSRRRGLDPREAKCAQIKRIDESIDRTNRIDLIDEVFEAFGLGGSKITEKHAAELPALPVPPDGVRESWNTGKLLTAIFGRRVGDGEALRRRRLKPLAAPSGNRRRHRRLRNSE